MLFSDGFQRRGCLIAAIVIVTLLHFARNMRSKIKKAVSRIQKKISKVNSEIRIVFCKNICVSVGENCLADNILQRHGVKSLTTPYSHGRSNLDYAIKLEKENYDSLLKHEHLTYDKVGVLSVVRNTTGFESDKIFTDSHRKGFEFTHHDVIKNKLHRRSYRRKVRRILRCRGKKNCNFYYHYRYNINSNLEQIFHKAEEFLCFYSRNGKKCTFNIFTQELVEKAAERGVRLIEYNPQIRAFIFKTHGLWAGEDQDLFWARNDDDLFKSMFQIIDNLEGREKSDDKVKAMRGSEIHI